MATLHNFTEVLKLILQFATQQKEHDASTETIFRHIMIASMASKQLALSKENRDGAAEKLLATTVPRIYPFAWSIPEIKSRCVQRAMDAYFNNVILFEEQQMQWFL